LVANEEGGTAGPNSVLVHLKTGQAWSVHGQVVDGSAGTAVAEFPLGESPSVPVGEYVELVFWGTQLNEPMPMRARVAACTQQGDHYRYRFQFEPGTVDALLSGVLDRRRATRIEPEQRTPVRVLVQGARQSVEGVLRDISEAGAGILICREDEEALFDAWVLTLVLRLPGDRDPLVLIGDVRHRRLHGSEVHFGIEFDPLKTEDFDVQQERIRAYIERRQAQDSKDEAAGRS
jgi:hypothetical protein